MTAISAFHSQSFLLLVPRRKKRISVQVGLQISLLFTAIINSKSLHLYQFLFIIFVKTTARETFRPNFKIHKIRSAYGEVFLYRNSNQNFRKRRIVKPSEFLQPKCVLYGRRFSENVLFRKWKRHYYQFLFGRKIFWQS